MSPFCLYHCSIKLPLCSHWVISTMAPSTTSLYSWIKSLSNGECTETRRNSSSTKKGAAPPTNAPEKKAGLPFEANSHHLAGRSACLVSYFGLHRRCSRRWRHLIVVKRQGEKESAWEKVRSWLSEQAAVQASHLQLLVPLVRFGSQLPLYPPVPIYISPAAAPLSPVTVRL